MQEYRTIDNLHAVDIKFSSTPVPAEALIGPEGDGLTLIEEVVDYATALLCAEAVGAIRYANDATLAYLKSRRQFGVPIGSFQALQHRMVDMFISYEQGRSMACLACVKVDTADAAERQRAVSAAKIKIADACRHVSQEAVQLHGGMGMTEELKISHTFRRLTMIAQAFAHDGPALVEVPVHRRELAMPPTISVEQMTGFGMFMVKAILNGRGDEIVDLARTNLWR